MFHFNFTVGISEVSSQAKNNTLDTSQAKNNTLWFNMHTKELNTNSFKY